MRLHVGETALYGHPVANCGVEGRAVSPGLSHVISAMPACSVGVEDSGFDVERYGLAGGKEALLAVGAAV